MIMMGSRTLDTALRLGVSVAPSAHQPTNLNAHPYFASWWPDTRNRLNSNNIFVKPA